MKNLNRLLILVFVSVAPLLTSCSTRAQPTPPGNAQLSGETAQVHLIPVRDPWPAAQPRWRDIADRPFDAYLNRDQNFSYANAQVTLEYSVQPQAAYFVGRIVAKGLKPNFAYQMKLAGKPTFGSRRWIHGDDLSNEILGFAGRWWCDTTQQNVNDDYYRRYARNRPANQRRSVYGYLFMGVLVTDENGEAEAKVRGDRSYHVTWRADQHGAKHIKVGDCVAQSVHPPFVGYGRWREPREAQLWYEWEYGRNRVVQLPPGTYNCRFLLTEESFHGVGGAFSGTWQTVLGSEEYSDAGAGNDIRFVIPTQQPFK